MERTDRLDSRKRNNGLYRLAGKRKTDAEDLQQVRVAKDRDANVLK